MFMVYTDIAKSHSTMRGVQFARSSSRNWRDIGFVCGWCRHVQRSKSNNRWHSKDRQFGLIEAILSLNQIAPVD
jgi:hypothetical protein